jgi:hypothetical protein
MPGLFSTCLQVDGNRYMSIAKLTGESLTDMTSRNNAPRIYAAVLRKPDFSNNDGFPEGRGVIPQVCVTLDQLKGY